MVVTPTAITFANLADSTMQPYSCEFNQLSKDSDADYLVSATVEQRAHGETRIFALTNNGEVVYFHAKIPLKSD